MYYIKISYAESFAGPSKFQYCEVGCDLYAKRSVEERWDGSLGYADENNMEGINGTILPEGKFPEIQDIFSVEGEFLSEIISAEKFEGIWLKAKGKSS